MSPLNALPYPRAMLSLVLIALSAVVMIGVVWNANRTINRYDIHLPRGAMPSGTRVARIVLAGSRVKNVWIEPGQTDCYLPFDRRIELERAHVRSTSAAAIAAHKAAHAVQHATRYLPFRVATGLMIPATLASFAWWPLTAAQITGGPGYLTQVGLGLFAFCTAFGLFLVWIEIDASRRAMRELHEMRAPGLDIDGARRVLIACAATYVADALLDLGFISRRMRSDGDGSTGSREQGTSSSGEPGASGSGSGDFFDVGGGDASF